MLPRRQQHRRVLDAPELQAVRPPARVLPTLDRVAKPRVVDRATPVRRPEYPKPQVRLYPAVALGHLGEALCDVLARTSSSRRPSQPLSHTSALQR